MSSLVIREVRSDEVKALQKISVKTFRQAFDEFNSEENMLFYINSGLALDTLSEELANPNSEFYFAVENHHIVGYLKLNFAEAQQEYQHDNSLEVQRIYVDEANQGKGLGQCLFDFALKRANEEQVEYVWLGVWEENHGAIRFYKKNGFEPFGKHTFPMKDDIQHDILMKKELN